MFNNNRLPKIKGTKKLIVKNQLLVSLGLPSLDIIIGGGIPVGSLFLLEEDESGVYRNIILKQYLAEGIVSDHTFLLASQDIDSHRLMTELPSPLHSDPTVDSNQDKKADNEQLRIAWRYQDLSLNHNADKSVPVFGNTYDLGYLMKSSLVEKADISHWPPPDINDTGNSYDNLLAYIKNIVEDPKYNFSAPVQDRTVLRIALISLATGSWSGNIHTFLIKLRFLLRNVCATCFISIPPHLFADSKELSRCEHLCDTVIQLKSLANDGNAAYSDYDGLLILKKLPIINTWNCTIPESNDWAFKVKKRHFIVEKLHISPEITDHVHREEEDVSNEYKTQKIISNIAHQF